MMRFKTTAFILGIVFSAMIFGGCGAKTDGEEAAIQGIPVEITQVTEGTVAIEDTITGNITPELEVPVVPKLGGPVANVPVKVGEEVQVGTLLVQLDTTDIEAQVRQAEAALEAARMAFINAEAQVPNALQIAQANYDAAKSSYDRMEYLYQEGGISEQQLEGAKTQLDVATAQLADAQNAPLQLDTLQAQVKQAQAAYDAAKTQLDNAFITSPIEGIVAAIHIEVGHMAGPGSPVVTVAKLNPVTAVFTLTESQVGKLSLGDEVNILAKAAGRDPLEGKVAEVAPSADPMTRGYKVKVALPNEEGVLKGGMTAQIGLTLEKVTEAIVVPVNSVVTKGNRQNIYLLEGEQVRECPVEVLLQNDLEAAIVGDVEAGAMVVTAGQNLLQDGSLVRVVSEEGK